MDQYLLEIKELSKSFYGNQVLQNINIRLKTGEIHAIVGENGAGKSTLMKILAGVERKDSGEIFLESRPVEIENPYQARSLGISMIFQELQLVPSLTVAENIFLGRWPLRSSLGLPVINWHKAVSEAKTLFQRLNFDINPHAKVSDLGTGQQKMVEIAKALCWSSKILILDEAAAALNDVETESFFKILKCSKEMGIAIFFISHQINEVLKIADTVTIFRDGRVVETNPIRNTDSKLIIRKMAEEDFVNRYPKIKKELGPEVLRVEHLRDYGVLEDISFFLRKGEIVGLTGLVGSGRTAVAKAIFGLNPLAGGRIYLNQQEVLLKSPVDAIKNKIAFVPEDRSDGLVDNMGIPENISLAYLKAVVTRNVIDIPLEKRVAKDYIKRVGIKVAAISQQVKYLSGGNQQKVLISKWLLSKAKIFIFDEPTKGLDISSKVEVYNLMNELIMDGSAILLISSDLDELLGMSDRILVMSRGKIVKELKGKDISEATIMYYAAGQD